MLAQNHDWAPSKSIKNQSTHIETHIKNNGKKGVEKLEKTSKNEIQSELKSIKNLHKNRCEKRDEKKGAIPEKTWAGGSRVGPKGYHFERFPSEENREESQLKGENKVECKKWSAKGTYRKASADREPTTHLNTLGGQRPRADSKRERAFRRARFFVAVGLWVCGYGCLLCCVVARSDAKPSCMLCCGVVGLWCVCVCSVGRVGPKGVQNNLHV